MSSIAYFNATTQWVHLVIMVSSFYFKLFSTDYTVVCQRLFFCKTRLDKRYCRDIEERKRATAADLRLFFVEWESPSSGRGALPPCLLVHPRAPLCTFVPPLAPLCPLVPPRTPLHSLWTLVPPRAPIVPSYSPCRPPSAPSYPLHPLWTLVPPRALYCPLVSPL